jgi:hypothetical protein
MCRRLAIASSLFFCFAGLTPGQAAAGVPSADVAAKTVLPTLTRYLRALDGVYTAFDDVLARTRAKALLPADAEYALGLRRALSRSNLAIAVAAERISALAVTSVGVGRVAIAAVVEHSYDLVTADTHLPETTWVEAMPTRAVIDEARPVARIEAFVQQARTNVHQVGPALDSVAGQPNSLDDVHPSPRAGTSDGTPRYPMSDSCGASPPDYCYFRADALNYVLAHACRTCHDPNWHYYRGEDCTNFMSAALYLQGNWLQQEYPNNYSTSWWWRSASIHSRTWTIANKFYWYLAERSRAIHASSLSRLIVGDLLQADWTGDGQMDHTAMVTRKDSTGIYLSYHSNDTRNKPWAAFRYGEPDAKYYGWNLQSIYDNRI